MAEDASASSDSALTSMSTTPSKDRVSAATVACGVGSVSAVAAGAVGGGGVAGSGALWQAVRNARRVRVARRTIAPASG